MKILSVVVLALGLATAFKSAPAYSQDFKEFLFCDNCSTSAQFESVAKTRPTRTGEWLYAVGNRVTGEMRFVTVFYTAPGQVPLSIGESTQKSASGGVTIMQVPIENPYVVAPEDSMVPFVSQSSGTWATSTRATPAEEYQFVAMVSAASNRIVVTSPLDKDGFDSLAGAQMELVGPYLWGKLTESNPGWAGTSITGSLKNALDKALGWSEGKGPVACIIFQNGDFACFQINPTAVSAPVYLEGTGKDRDNNPISRTPSLPNGGGFGTKVVHENGDARGYSAGGNSRLICAFVNGGLDHCWVEYVIQ